MNGSKAIYLNSAEDTQKIGKLLGSCIDKQLVIGLVGKLGAGKTTLTQGLAAQLGIDEAVNSPTFLMLNEYHSGRLSLYHFDLYRLQEDLSAESAPMQALKAEFDELMTESAPAVVVVEWINLWEEFTSEYDELRVQLEYDEESGGRKLSLNTRGSTAAVTRQLLEERWAGACPPENRL